MKQCFLLHALNIKLLAPAKYALGQPPSHTLHPVATAAEGKVYVEDQGIQQLPVFKSDSKSITQHLNVVRSGLFTSGLARITYVFSSDHTRVMENGKMNLAREIVGKSGTTRKIPKQVESLGGLDGKSVNQMVVGKRTRWQKRKPDGSG